MVESFTPVYNALVMRNEQVMITAYTEYKDYVDDFCYGCARYVDNRLAEIITKNDDKTTSYTMRITQGIANTNNFGTCSAYIKKKEFCQIVINKLKDYFTNLGFDVTKSEVEAARSGNNIAYTIVVTISWKLETTDEDTSS